MASYYSPIWWSWQWRWWWWSGRSVLNFDLPTFIKISHMSQSGHVSTFSMSIKSQFYFHQMSRKGILCCDLWCIGKSNIFPPALEKKLVWAHDKRRQWWRLFLEVKKNHNHYNAICTAWSISIDWNSLLFTLMVVRNQFFMSFFSYSLTRRRRRWFGFSLNSTSM